VSTRDGGFDLRRGGSQSTPSRRFEGLNTKSVDERKIGSSSHESIRYGDLRFGSAERCPTNQWTSKLAGKQ
jgi:hypothetical protein